MDAIVQLTSENLELKAQTGWMCPKCHTVHAPFISVCSFCDANKNPRVQAWLLNDLKDRLKITEHTKFVLTRNELQRLVEAVSAQK